MSQSAVSNPAATAAAPSSGDWTSIAIRIAISLPIAKVPHATSNFLAGAVTVAASTTATAERAAKSTITARRVRITPRLPQAPETISAGGQSSGSSWLWNNIPAMKTAYHAASVAGSTRHHRRIRMVR